MGGVRPLSKEKLAEYCRKNGIKWLATHEAEVVRRNFPDVQLFLLVEFEKDQRVGFFRLFEVQEELSSLFGGLTADLRTLPELRDFYRDEVMSAAEVQFVA